jgi:hypothetical protein
MNSYGGLNEEEYQEEIRAFRSEERLGCVLMILDWVAFMVIGASAMWILLSWLN